METAYIAIGAALVYAACAAAAVGAFLPVLPGPLLSFAAILAFKLALPDSQLGWWNVGICGALAAFAQAADIFMSWIGAKKVGATWRGGLGAFVGVFVGIVLPPAELWISRHWPGRSSANGSGDRVCAFRAGRGWGRSRARSPLQC